MSRLTRRRARAVAAGLAGVYRPDGGHPIRGKAGTCSAGFAVRRNAKPFLLTAGHCTDVISRWKTGSGQLIGRTVSTSWGPDDYGLVGVRDPALLHPQGVVVNDNRMQDITRAAYPRLCARVCKTGTSTGTTCGTVTRRNMTVNVDGTIVGDLVETNLCAREGDSGGPLFSGSTAHGVLTGGTLFTSGTNRSCTLMGFRTWYQPAPEALKALNLTLA
jgi:hypothetical protein